MTIDEAGEPATARQRGPLSLAAAVGRTAKVILVAPATQILLAEPELPPGTGVRLARAVPFALEEQLTEDVDQLVFALGKRRASGGTPVAVVSRSVLQGWLAELSAAGMTPAAVYADMSLLPLEPGPERSLAGAWTIVGASAGKAALWPWSSHPSPRP